MISLYAEKNFYNRDYNEVDIFGSYKNFYFIAAVNSLSLSSSASNSRRLGAIS